MGASLSAKVGRRVRSERERLGLSQEGLAARAGVHRTYVGMIERGERNVTLESLEKICKALGLGVGELLKCL